MDATWVEIKCESVLVTGMRVRVQNELKRKDDGYGPVQLKEIANGPPRT